MTRPVVTHITAPLSQRALWLSLLIPYTDPFMGDRYVAWPDTAPRTTEPVRFFYHWESKVGVSHVGNVVAPWGRNTYRR